MQPGGRCQLYGDRCKSTHNQINLYDVYELNTCTLLESLILLVIDNRIFENLENILFVWRHRRASKPKTRSENFQFDIREN